VQTIAERALLVLELATPTLEVLMPLAERLRQVAEPGLLGEGVHEEVLGRLDVPRDGLAGIGERREARLRRTERRFGLGKVAAQAVDLVREDGRFRVELREPGPDPDDLVLRLARPRRELVAAQKGVLESA
jgi:hypothetical protein